MLVHLHKVWHYIETPCCNLINRVCLGRDEGIEKSGYRGSVHFPERNNIGHYIPKFSSIHGEQDWSPANMQNGISSWSKFNRREQESEVTLDKPIVLSPKNSPGISAELQYGRPGMEVANQGYSIPYPSARPEAVDLAAGVISDHHSNRWLDWNRSYEWGGPILFPVVTLVLLSLLSSSIMHNIFCCWLLLKHIFLSIKLQRRLEARGTFTVCARRWCAKYVFWFFHQKDWSMPKIWWDLWKTWIKRFIISIDSECKGRSTESR